MAHNSITPRRITHTIGKFYGATSFTDEVHEIDKSHGRAIMINGDVFYSPNCTRSFVPPPSSSPNPGQHVSSVEQPLWWSMDYVHLAFLPLQGQGVHPLDDFLPAPTWFVRSQGQFWLDPQVILKWNLLQHQLLWIIKILADRCKIPPYPSVITSALVKSSRYRDAYILRREVANGKGWFLYWAAQLAYAIAVNISIDGSPVHPTYDVPPEGEDATNFDWNSLLNNALPPWFEFLGTCDWPQTLLCVIQNCVARFDANSRVGIFLNIAQPKPRQFSVDWFMKFNVPVWYPWGSGEKEAALNNSSVSRLAPLPHHLQQVATMLHKSPYEMLPENGGAIAPARQPWIAFLAKREEENMNMERWETPADKQKRQNRERQHPTANARVFEWEKDDGDVYRRVEVPKAERTDVLETYGRKQKVYNAFFNEWDCIIELGELEQEEIDQMDWGEDTILYDPLPPSGVDDYQNMEGLAYDQSEFYVPPVVHTAGLPSSSVVTDHLLPTSIAAIGEVSHILHVYFGYVPPIGDSQASKQTPTANEKLQTARAIGLNDVDNKYFNSTEGIQAVKFVRLLSSESDLPALDHWDLRSGNRWALGTSNRLRYLKMLGSRFLFDFGDAATTPWMLCVEQAEIALFVCRLGEQLKEAAIVKELLERGIPHQTLVTLPSCPVSLPDTVRLSVRLPGYVFGAADYVTYRNQMKNLLRDPRVVRAALMTGGIAWRLVLFRGFDLVIEGPTAELDDERVGISIPTDILGWDYCDDTCSARELDVLCGAYICYNGRKSPQFVVKSWWPLVSTWKKHVYHPWWTEHYNKIIDDQIKQIKKGDAQPLAQSEWRKILRGNSISKKMLRNTTAHSLDFLKTAVGGEFPGLK